MVKKAAEYNIASIEVLKEKANNKYRNLSEEEKKVNREYGKNKYRSMKEKTRLKNVEEKKYQICV